jgi:hypothetical protein
VLAFKKQPHHSLIVFAKAACKKIQFLHPRIIQDNASCFQSSGLPANYAPFKGHRRATVRIFSVPAALTGFSNTLFGNVLANIQTEKVLRALFLDHVWKLRYLHRINGIVGGAA